jgi:diguanylate cyclase (GGDEF)-like protein/PAS domain S-box-containing protein
VYSRPSPEPPAEGGRSRRPWHSFGGAARLRSRMFRRRVVEGDERLVMRAQEEIALQAELLDEVDAAVTFSDSDGVVRYWSRGAERLYGYTAEEAHGRLLTDLMMVDEGDAEVQRLRSGVLAGRPVAGELDVRDKQGRAFSIYARVRGVPLGAAGGEAGGGVISISVDISARREAERALARRARGQEEIAKLGRLALGTESLEELFDYAVGVASRALSAECAWLVECLPDDGGFVVRAAVGWPGERRGEHIAAGARSMSGYAVSSQGPVVVEDWQQERRFTRSSKLLTRGVRSSVAAPIGDPEGPFGVLAVHYPEPGAVPPDSIAFLDALANVLADAVRSRNERETIRHQALHDGLTGLPNRTLFFDRVAHALAETDRNGQPPAVFFIDLDRFKLVNDSLGHETADELLRLVASRLAGAIRPGDTLARLDGDEFAVLCKQLPSEVSAIHVANQLLAALERPVVLDGENHVVSASVGVALSAGTSNAADLLRDADSALYKAKTAGRARAELFDKEMQARVLGCVRTESALRTALASEESLYVHYQPLVSLRGGQVIGAEALARWWHPDWGPVSPVEFIPVAEDSGLIHELGALVMRRAVRESAVWGEHVDFAGISVNVSARQLIQHEEVAELVRDVIAVEGIAPGFLTLEITESMLIERLDAARSTLASLVDLGVGLSLDDFGTGYSSLGYLGDLPFGSVKIDRSLIKDIVDTPRAAALAAAIVQMGHALELEVIAEGVEKPAQAALLGELDCDIAQGSYFGQPMAPDQLAALLKHHPDWLCASANPPMATQRRQTRARTTRQEDSNASKQRRSSSTP